MLDASSGLLRQSTRLRMHKLKMEALRRRIFHSARRRRLARAEASGLPDNRVVHTDRGSELPARSMDATELQPWSAAGFFATSTGSRICSPPHIGSTKGFVIPVVGEKAFSGKFSHVASPTGLQHKAVEAQSGGRRPERELRAAPSRRRGLRRVERLQSLTASLELCKILGDKGNQAGRRSGLVR
jgi:hypothetical protein